MSAATGLSGPASGTLASIGLGNAGLAGWLVDTFVYTGLLIGIVMLLRRPVARHFGPQVAYALWALPFLRLVMPPLVLPAWMAPAEPAAVDGSVAEAFVVILPAAGESVASAGAGLSPTELLVPLWLTGAAVFLALRVRSYILMRQDLLAEARPMGHAGTVRLVETPAVTAPVAFGIRDKVVALPVDFMGRIDRGARDMAIAHELAHHRGHDLLANLAAQPLLALHWFNPLAWWGWRAMRRDQEAACDARVVAGRARSERVAYAEVIAGFAAGQHLALAAPMASALTCPVLGEKSIIHRLRSLAMTEHSTTRRRLGIAAITTTALALPLTASISYARSDNPPGRGGEGSGVTQVADGMREFRQDTVEGDGSRQTVVIRVSEDGNDVSTRVVSTTRSDGDEAAAEHAAALADYDAEMADLDAELADLDAELADMDDAVQRDVRLAMAEARAQSREAVAEGRRAAAEVRRMAVVREGSSAGPDCMGENAVVERQLENGRRALIVCQSALNTQAISGLREALAEIRTDRDIPVAAREQVIRQIERTIEQMERGHRGAVRMELSVPVSAAIGTMSAARGMVMPPAPPTPPVAVSAPSHGSAGMAGTVWTVRMADSEVFLLHQER
ncbi:hypothetical protein GRI62_07295 [Erythrobacter arachoides]|uniref:Peptidase M56 domain-containing protein n=1 Tax=Aurantiacibacter arachoides TaxID=1850444 RepID=A0A845A798_9SPHN|nr:M56 family metallopeptidase [Aurantiacibacter arachoides]MXO93409.1 hypothetical protein [Aurantiacibacter arachoides]GGD49603.1 hypothetical protein GCM10011411_06730 [Aurantiacibacter arachoides]